MYANLDFYVEILDKCYLLRIKGWALSQRVCVYLRVEGGAYYIILCLEWTFIQVGVTRREALIRGDTYL